ncbi:MAG: Ig-like domain-containing protein [Thermoanaerobaculia bacterium]|nr:Ig-like domain-containing protein [Thermoanaerobaculia bacterium]
MTSLRVSSALLLAALAALVPARAQAPNPSPFPGVCTVSLVNQTSRVPANGIWQINTVPANVGPVRARLTCIDNGVTRTAASSPVPVLPGRRTAIPFGDFDFTVATPRAVEISLPASLPTTAGTAVQATVVATWADGSTADVTSAETSLYVSSNPAIATVSPTGLVTLQSSGRVLISVVHEAILDSVALTLVLAGDDDGDGLPNDWEVANGLLPNDPADAREDADGDGLDNLAEFGLGTDPRDADSDGDGIFDGEEVVAGADGFVTNPLLADSDGDGVPDGLERFVGTNPTLAGSVDYAAVLVRLDAAPTGFTLIKNLVFPQETSRRVRILGTLLDGSTVDVTARGVAYQSSLPAVLIVASEPGRVVAGVDGNAVLTASFAGRSTQVPVVVTSFNPTPLSFLKIPGAANAVELHGDHAVVASGATGLYVVDVTNPLAPEIVGAVDTPGNANDLVIVGDYAYVADGNGLVIVDLADPTAPQIVASWLLPGDASQTGPVSDLAVQDGRTYLAAGNTLRIVDVANPFVPVERSVLAVSPPGFRTYGVAVAGELAVVTAGGAGVYTVDIGDDFAPVKLGHTHLWPASQVSYASAVVLWGERAYVGQGSGPGTGRLAVIDVSVPTTPAVVAYSNEVFGLMGLAFDGNLLFGADFMMVNGVPVWDVGGQPVPAFRGAIDLVAPPLQRDDNGNGLAVGNGFLYLAGNRNYPGDNHVTGDSALHIARYAVFSEDDGRPPVVEMTGPADGAAVPDRRRLTLTATAVDDVRIQFVTFAVDGVVIGTDFVAPFEAFYTPPLGNGPRVVTATATDFGGNSATDSVTVQVVPSGLPVARILAPVASSTVTTGTSIPVVVEATDDVAVTAVQVFRNGVLVETKTAPPFSFLVPVPAGLTQASIVATAVDGQGQSDTTAPVLVTVVPNQPPTVSWVSPTNGGTVVVGQPIPLLVEANDDVAVASVRFFRNGQFQIQDNAAPWAHSFVAPNSPTTLTFAAQARDGESLASAMATISITVIPDPLTTVQGLVASAAGAPVPGVTVSVLGKTAVTGGDGRFSIPAVPTIQGNLVVSTTFAGQLATSAPAAPVVGGVTDVGTVTFQPNQSPTVTIVTPTAGTSVVVGTPIPVSATAADDVAVTKVEFFLDGNLLATDSTVPYSAQIPGQPTAGTRLVSAVAYDAWGASSNPSLVTVEIAADAGTTVIGQVELFDGSPIAGAGVAALGVQGTTGPDGSFSLSGVPATQGAIVVTASHQGLNLASGAFAPVAGGLTDVGTIVFPQNEPPSVLIWEPFDGQEVFAGTQVTISVEGADEALPPGLELFIDGISVASEPSAGAIWFVWQTPVVPATVEIEAVATDALGATASQTITVSVVPDTRTTLEGVVLNADGEPEEGAEVLVLGGSFVTTTGADGSFSLPEVPTAFGPLDIQVTAADGARTTLPAVTGVPSGLTDLGTITLPEPCFEAFGDPLILGDDTSAWVAFPPGFTIPFQGVARTGLWVNANGNVTWDVADPSNLARDLFRGTANGVDVKARVAPLFVDLEPQQSPPGGGVFVRQEVDRVIVTWYKVPSSQGRNSVQLILWNDGRLRFSYGVVAATGFGVLTPNHLTTGITPAGNVSLFQFDWNSAPIPSWGAGTVAYYSYVRDDFDLGRSKLDFTPNGAGGFDALWTPLP